MRNGNQREQASVQAMHCNRRTWTRRARLGLVLCLMACLPSCGLLSLRPAPTPVSVDVVVTPGALDPCVLSRWIVPDPLSADQAATLALAARKESEQCAAQHAALIDDVRRHNGE